MRGSHLKPLPTALLGLTLALEVAAVALSAGLEAAYDTWGYAVVALATGGAGALVASRRPENPIGWLFCAGTLILGAGDLAQGYGLQAVVQGWAGGPVADWVSSWSWLPSGLCWTWTFLLFPDGRTLGPRWRAVGWAGALGTLLAAAGWSLSADRDADFPSRHNPLAVPALPTGLLLTVGMVLFLGAFLAAGGSLVVRFRRSAGVERQQLRWIAWAAALAVVLLPLSFLLWNVVSWAGVLSLVALTALPVAAGVAILRYRLYDLDLVVQRTLVYAALSVLLGAAYAATTLVLGTALDTGSAWVTAVATLVAAAAFRPLRGRLQSVVDRRLGSERTDALRRMGAFLDDLRADRAAPEELESVLRDVLRDPTLELHFEIPEGERHVDARGAAVHARADDGRRRVPIERSDLPLGVVVHDGAACPSPSLVADVVAAAGLAIEIARLRVELRHQLTEVEASRARIVEAAHEERRRIERDLHDGAQQRLVSIGLALRNAQYELGGASPPAVDGVLDDAVAQLTTAIGELRELARGLPPWQLDGGLAPALRELAARAPLPVRVEVGRDRLSPGVEAAAYFIACEGLTNVVKHAHAQTVVLSAARANGHLVVRVSDDGVGGAAAAVGSGLTGLQDRVLAAGGTFRVDSPAGAGTTLVAELPCAS